MWSELVTYFELVTWTSIWNWWSELVTNFELMTYWWSEHVIWTCSLIWWFELVTWHCDLNWWPEMVIWTGHLNVFSISAWSELVTWTRDLNFCIKLVNWTVNPANSQYILVAWTSCLNRWSEMGPQNGHMNVILNEEFNWFWELACNLIRWLDLVLKTENLKWWAELGLGPTWELVIWNVNMNLLSELVTWAYYLNWWCYQIGILI